MGKKKKKRKAADYKREEKNRQQWGEKARDRERERESVKKGKKAPIQILIVGYPFASFFDRLATTDGLRHRQNRRARHERS
jgi:hypothetical protein